MFFKHLLASRSASEIVGYIGGCRRCFPAQEALSSIPMSSFTVFGIVARRRAENNRIFSSSPPAGWQRPARRTLVEASLVRTLLAANSFTRAPQRPSPWVQVRQTVRLSYKLMPEGVIKKKKYLSHILKT